MSEVSDTFVCPDCGKRKPVVTGNGVRVNICRACLCDALGISVPNEVFTPEQLEFSLSDAQVAS